MGEDYKSFWFTSSYFPIGIVKTPSGKTYIGAAQGIDEADDEKFIAKYGSPIDLLQVAKSLGIQNQCEKET